MSKNPTASTQYVVVESSDPIPYKDYQEKLVAKLYWPSFFEWDASNYDELITEFEDIFKTWIHEQDLDYFEITEQNDYHVKGVVALSLFLQPPEWRKQACRDRASLGAIQSEIMVFVSISAFLWDDVFDSICCPGADNYYLIKQAVATTVEKIMNQDFKNLGEVYEYLQKSGNLLLEPKYKTMLAAQQKVSEMLREKLGIKTREEHPYLAIESRMVFDYLTMSSGNGLEVLMDSQKQDIHRCYTSASYLWSELYVVLSNLRLNPNVREDKYLKRVRYLGAKLACVVNDILSFEKEAGKDNADNIIAHFVNGGLELIPAIDRAVEVYNSCVHELEELKCYLDSGKHPAPTDADPFKAAQLEKEYKEAIRLAFVFPATNFQAQVLCNRYSQNWRFE